MPSPRFPATATLLDAKRCPFDKFDALFTKITQERRIRDGYFVQDHPDEARVLFVVNGSPYGAGRVVGEACAHSEIHEFFTAYADCPESPLSFFVADKRLLLGLMVLFRHQPAMAFKTNLVDISAVLETLAERQTDQILALRSGGEWGISLCTKGRPVANFLASDSAAGVPTPVEQLEAYARSRAEGVALDVYEETRVGPAGDVILARRRPEVVWSRYSSSGRQGPRRRDGRSPHAGGAAGGASRSAARRITRHAASRVTGTGGTARGAAGRAFRGIVCNRDRRALLLLADGRRANGGAASDRGIGGGALGVGAPSTRRGGRHGSACSAGAGRSTHADSQGTYTGGRALAADKQLGCFRWRPVTIGRLGNTIAIDNAGVSRRHAVIRVKGDKVVLEDLGSANGTFVRGQRIEEYELRDGDEIAIVKHRLVYRVPKDAETQARVEPVQDVGQKTMYIDAASVAQALGGRQGGRAEAAAPRGARGDPPDLKKPRWKRTKYGLRSGPGRDPAIRELVGCCIGSFAPKMAPKIQHLSGLAGPVNGEKIAEHLLKHGDEIETASSAARLERDIS
jgi:pSer/pThr/pTyr-binding forkhead associated (FHA) protein